jgi:sterol desaturase/sphingolipid hydroxylase (fatty acid hydroxylase superfamily)
MWEFHKVHHSAQVLMPITAYRQHPVEELMTGAINGIAVGLVGGAFLYWSDGGLGTVDVAGHNAIELAFILAGRHLRHSHIPLSFGRLAEHLFISPAQHRLHHSIALRHRDRNLGQIFAVWDWMFGTLYVCRPEPQDVVYGIDGRAEHDFKDIKAIYFGPFQALAARTDQRRETPSSVRQLPD